MKKTASPLLGAAILMGMLHLGLQAQTLVTPNLVWILNRMESHRFGWLGMRAQVRLDFAAGNEQAACWGELLYQRLDERIRLECFAEDGNLVFGFSSFDRDFELYLPDEETLFQGDIFDLQDSKTVDSFLDPRNLYRALKPMAIPSHQAEIADWDRRTVTLRVEGRKRTGSYLSRKVTLSHEGFVLAETYYNFNETPRLEIKRFEFKKIPDRAKSGAPTVIYPTRIVLEDYGTGGEGRFHQIVFTFDSIDFLPVLKEADWNLKLPEKVRVVSLEEEFRSSSFSKRRVPAA